MRFDLFATTVIHADVVHDWTVMIGGLAFGIREAHLYGFRADRPPDTSTVIFVGRTTVETRLPAWGCLSIAAIATFSVVAAISFVITKYGRRQGTAA